MSDVWTAQAIDRLRELWAEGVPTAEIARRIGASKNAVVGKANRLGLPPRRSPIRPKEKAAPARPSPIAATAPAGPAQPVADLASARQRTGLGLMSRPPGSAAVASAGPAEAQASGAGARPGALKGAAALEEARRRAAEAAAAREAERLRQVDAARVAGGLPTLADVRAMAAANAVNRYGCRWIDGDPRKPGWRYCDAPRVTGKPYCAAHCARAYVRPGEAEAAA